MWNSPCHFKTAYQSVNGTFVHDGPCENRNVDHVSEAAEDAQNKAQVLVDGSIRAETFMG